MIKITVFILLPQVTCRKCGQKSQTKEPFTDLSLEFPPRYHYRGPGIPICYEKLPVEGSFIIAISKSVRY